MKKIISAFLVAAILCVMAPAASAADSTALAAADALHALGLFEGVGTGADGKPIYDLDRAPKRDEAVTMLVRLLGKDAMAKAEVWKTPFTDVAEWAKPYVGYAYAVGLTGGTGKTTFGGGAKVTAAQYLTFVLRALGYEDGTDFKWDAAWELTDRLGLTAGQYNAANNTAFLRGDVAIVSNAALGIKVKNSTKTLLETVSASGETDKKADYMKRLLSDSEISALKGAALDTVRAKISTLGDALAYLDSFQARMFSNIGSTPCLTPALAMEELQKGISGTDTYTCLTGYFLSDDINDMGYVMAVVNEKGSYWILSALYLPEGQGYWIFTPAAASATKSNNNCSLAGLQETVISDFSTLGADLKPLQVCAESPIEQVYLASAAQQKLSFAWNGTVFEPESGTVKRAYAMSQTEKEAADEATRQSRVKQAWRNIDANWSSYGMPSALAPTLSRKEAEALYGADLDTVAAAVKTIGDCIFYYAGAGFDVNGGDLQTSGDGSLFWHYNFVPRQVLANNSGCCGAISGLTAYLLEGDYDAVGIVGITFAAGEGGGHVINYVQNGGVSYVFDMINLISTQYQQRGFLFTAGDALKQTTDAWSAASPWTEKLMYAYQSTGGDAPVGWDNTHSSMLPVEYQEGAVILMEHPAEGYEYKWVTINDSVWKEINRIRAGF